MNGNHLKTASGTHVGKTNNSIEINGKRYNATTGALITDFVNKKPVKKVPVVVATQAAPKPTKPTMSDVVARKPASHVNGHAPTPAKTLMRRSVKKPAPSLKRHIKAQASTDSAHRGTLAQTPAHAVKKIDQHRLQKAKRIAQSQSVTHFSKTQPSTTFQAAQPVTVQHHSPAPQPIARPHHKPAKTTADLLERALQNATTHQQPAHRAPRRSHTKAGLVVTAAVIFAAIGIFGSQNLTNLRLHMASARAGFTASLPKYQPAGYQLGQLNYSSGEVSSRFASTSNDGSYSVLQKQSPWDSVTLRDNFVIPADPQYQSVQSGGQTIFLYGKHSATWVNGGVWYQIQSDGSLSDRQLVQLATSL